MDELALNQNRKEKKSSSELFNFEMSTVKNKEKN